MCPNYCATNYCVAYLERFSRHFFSWSSSLPLSVNDELKVSLRQSGYLLQLGLTGSIRSKEKDIQIPRVQKRALAKSFAEYARMSQSRDESIVRAYASGGLLLPADWRLFQAALYTDWQDCKKNQGGLKARPDSFSFVVPGPVHI